MIALTLLKSCKSSTNSCLRKSLFSAIVQLKDSKRKTEWRAVDMTYSMDKYLTPAALYQDCNSCTITSFLIQWSGGYWGWGSRRMRCKSALLWLIKSQNATNMQLTINYYTLIQRATLFCIFRCAFPSIVKINFKIKQDEDGVKRGHEGVTNVIPC